MTTYFSRHSMYYYFINFLRIVVARKEHSVEILSISLTWPRSTSGKVGYGLLVVLDINVIFGVIVVELTCLTMLGLWDGLPAKT